MPPKTQTPRTMGVEPTARIICEVTRKIPLPITVPTTIDTATGSPSMRPGSCLCGSTAMGGLLYAQRNQDGRHKRSARADHDVPGEGDGRGEAHIQQQN